MNAPEPSSSSVPNEARRNFLRTTGAAALLSAAWKSGLAADGDAKASAKTAAEFCPGKDARLLAYNTKTGEIETPIALLREHRVTPKELLFVRNNQITADALSLQPAPLEGWKIEVTGLVDAPRTLNAADLKKLPQVEHEMVLQCSGNGRSSYGRTVKAEGVQWGNGAMGNVRLKGVSLAAVLDFLNVRPKPVARFLTVEGADAPDKPGAADFEHSVPLDEAMKKSLLVLEMNGEPLSRLHGGPVRFVLPGYYATMNVKWANRMSFAVQESSNHHHVGRYRTPLTPLAPGAKFTSTLENSEPNWNMKIKSVIFSPLEGESLAAGPVVVNGVAFNDGASKIGAVEVSTDGGQTWRRATLEPEASPYAWRHWKLAVDLSGGSHTILSRAIDVQGTGQPLDGSVHWNPAGYAWNGVDQVKVAIAP